jgi:hypothetical protein
VFDRELAIWFDPISAHARRSVSPLTLTGIHVTGRNLLSTFVSTVVIHDIFA